MCVGTFKTSGKCPFIKTETCKKTILPLYWLFMLLTLFLSLRLGFKINEVRLILS